MAKTVNIRVNERKTAGKGAARAERRAGLIPGVIYGEKKEPVMFSISALDLDAQLRQSGFWTRQFEIEVGKNKYTPFVRTFRRTRLRIVRFTSISCVFPQTPNCRSKSPSCTKTNWRLRA